MKKILFLSLTTLLLGSCSIMKPTTTTTQTTHTLALRLNQLPPSNTYINMDYGIRLNIVDKRASTEILNHYDGSAALMSKPLITTYPDVKSFVSESIKEYMQTMGFDLNTDISTDYMLQIDITQYQVSYLSGSGWMGTVCFDMQIFDESQKQVYPRTTITGRSSSNTGSNTLSVADKVLNDAYLNALDNVDWNRVAYFLKRSKHASQEKNKQVTGDGDTALEHTIIRWFIDSAPKGADVFWRVVSSTPDVKNTNQTYLGTTPYESTESFDIKGLTFNNSGNIQIEISCEKAGYATQKKRFNLRQAIEQKEISTKFSLYKDE